MKTFKVTESDGTVRIFNPRYITDVKLVVSDYNKDWCVVIFIPKREVYTILCNTKEEALEKMDEINSCLESI